MSKTLTRCRVTAPATSQHEAPDNSRWFENDLATGTKRALTMVWVPTKRAVIGNVVKLTRPDTGPWKSGRLSMCGITRLRPRRLLVRLPGNLPQQEDA